MNKQKCFDELTFAFVVEKPKVRVCRKCNEPTQEGSYFHCAYHKKLADSMAEFNEIHV